MYGTREQVSPREDPPPPPAPPSPSILRGSNSSAPSIHSPKNIARNYMEHIMEKNNGRQQLCSIEKRQHYRNQSY
jgi:hypothetical protein